ncbi:MAG: hypothetical protein MUC38_15420 [Cyclobacteriaceae bacterium]|jgi:hypothetical protein|nr:hypothetical protein [Cyclobacteriaceae bacterium]
MRGLIFILLITPIESFGQFLRPDTIIVPPIQKVGRNEMDFVPTSWEILREVSGDLNRDKKKDHVMILGVKNHILVQKNIDTTRNEVPRLLLVLISDRDKWRLEVFSDKAILPSGFGGGFDPIEFNEPLSINEKERSLIISMYGGLRERCTVNYTFKKNRGIWSLFAAEKMVYDSTSPEGHGEYYSIDFVKKEIRSSKTEKIQTLKWRKPPSLKDFRPFEYEIFPGLVI